MSFVGTPDGLEARLVSEAGVPFVGLDARGFDRARPWTLVTSSLRTLSSALKAWRLLGATRPDVVVGFGGYVSIPLGLAAVWRRIPLVLHEQNSVPGLANRYLSMFAAAVGVTYPGSRERLAKPDRVTVTGNPVRPRIVEATREEGRRAMGIPADAVLVLAFGGSRGARHLNSALIGATDRILAREGVWVIHVAGTTEAETVRAALEAEGGEAGGRWRVLGYLDDMPSALAAADLVIARAGATSIAEITARGIAAILVPYPYATDDHQTHNAAAVVEAGGAVAVPDSDLDTPRFTDAIDALLEDSEARATMAAASRTIGRPDAARRVADLARSVAAQHAQRT